MQRLRRHRSAIRSLVAEKGGGDVLVFGSVARGEAGGRSDIDLFVELPDGIGLMALAELEADLSELLNTRVDVIPTSVAARSPSLRSALDENAIAL